MTRPFTDVLGDLERGGTACDLTEALTEVVSAVQATGKKGQVKFPVDIKPNGPNSVELLANIAKKVPEHDRPRTMMFIDKNHALRRDDPRQPKLPLQAVPEPEDDLTNIDEDDQEATANA